MASAEAAVREQPEEELAPSTRRSESSDSERSKNLADCATSGTHPLGSRGVAPRAAGDPQPLIEDSSTDASSTAAEAPRSEPQRADPAARVDSTPAAADSGPQSEEPAASGDPAAEASEVSEMNTEDTQATETAANAPVAETSEAVATETEATETEATETEAAGTVAAETEAPEAQTPETTEAAPTETPAITETSETTEEPETAEAAPTERPATPEEPETTAARAHDGATSSEPEHPPEGVVAPTATEAATQSTAQNTQSTAQESTFADPSERRHSERKNLELSLYSDSNFYAGLSENISARGIFVATHKLCKRGDLIDLRITLPNDEEVIAHGVVRWIREYNEASDTPPGMGIEFLEVEGESLIAEFLAARPPLFHDE